MVSYRAALENLDSNALQRQLRDRRFDGTVQRAISAKEALKPAQVEKMTDRYRQRTLKHRSEVIARTEALRSVNMGINEQYAQAIQAGDLQSDQLVQIWNTAGDARVRDFSNGAQTSHQSMQGQERPVGLPFTSGAGNSLSFPGDPSAPGFETIQCRCVVSTRILSLGEIPGGVNITVLQG